MNTCSSTTPLDRKSCLTRMHPRQALIYDAPPIPFWLLLQLQICPGVALLAASSSLTTAQEALQFIDRLVLLCERNCLALQDFTGEQGPVTALDLGCAVGGSSFALARAFQVVVGVDSSEHFIKAAQVSIISSLAAASMSDCPCGQSSWCCKETRAVARHTAFLAVRYCKGRACWLSHP